MLTSSSVPEIRSHCLQMRVFCLVTLIVHEFQCCNEDHKYTDTHCCHTRLKTTLLHLVLLRSSCHVDISGHFSGFCGSCVAYEFILAGESSKMIEKNNVPWVYST